MNTKFDLKAFKETLKTWVNFETPTGDEGRLKRFSSLVSFHFENAGAKVTTIDLPGGPVLHASLGMGKRRCVLMGHMDTVFPLGQAEKYDEENGRLYGAGVLDMKSGLLMLVKVFESVSKILPEGWRIEAIVNSDEERGSKESSKTLEKLLEGSDLVFSFEGNRENCVTVSRKGIWTFEIEARGIASHASGGADKEKSAVYAISKCVCGIYHGEYPKSVSVNIGIIQGGNATNVVSDRAVIRGEIRGETPEDLDRAETEIIEICRLYNCAYQKATQRPPMSRNEKTMCLFDLIKSIEPDLTARSAGGGGDAAYAYLSGAYVMDGMGAEGARAHTRREYVEESSIEKRFRLSQMAVLKAMNEFDSIIKQDADE